MTIENTKNNLYNSMKEIITMPYFRNYQAVSGAAHNTPTHEYAVCDVLRRQNFKEHKLMHKISQNEFVQMKKTKSWNGMKNNEFILQPQGPNRNPDILLKYNDILVFIECKSSKGSHPVYNSNLPSIDYIYVFCGQKSNETTIYFGSSIVTPEEREILSEYVVQTKKTAKTLTDNLSKIDSNNRGMGVYNREMYTQYGMSKLNYFTHPNRKKDETNVLLYCKNLGNNV